MTLERDMNRDPITGSPGSHPVGTGVGSAGGAAGGAVIGSVFGPLGALIGGGIGAVAGGAGGHAAAEQINPTGEIEYWRENHTERPYYEDEIDFDRDLEPAYRQGVEARNKYHDRDWDDRLESELKEEWSEFKADSSLAWERAKHAVRDGWDRTDRNYRAYSVVDEHYENEFNTADYYDEQFRYDDYRPAYRFGTYARSQSPERDWDDRLEAELREEWNEFKGESRLAWNKAKHATKDAWHNVERAIPGDFDNDGR